MQTEVDSPKLTTKGKLNVTFPVEGQEAGQGYLAESGKDSKVGLIVISEWWGLNENITTKTEMLGALGFKALAVDVYRGNVATDRESAGHLVKGLNFEGAVKDIAAAAKYLIEEFQCTHVGAVGYCMGGALALATASRKTHLSAVVAYYGTPDIKVFSPADLTIPVLANFGTLDQAVGFSDVATGKNYEKLALEANKDFKMIFYEAQHSFTNKDTPRYDAAADQLSLTNTIEFFKDKLRTQE